MSILRKNIILARDIGQKLYNAFAVSGEGIWGQTEMPEDILPAGMERGSLEHLLFITLTATIDYQRKANELWKIARETYQHPSTRYLFDPAAIHGAGLSRVSKDMKRAGLSKKPKKDPFFWHTVAVSFFKKWGGDPRNFLADCKYHGPTIVNRLRSDEHIRGGTSVTDFPYLRGSKISCLWIRMLRDNVWGCGVRPLFKG